MAVETKAAALLFSGEPRRITMSPPVARAESTICVTLMRDRTASRP